MLFYSDEMPEALASDVWRVEKFVLTVKLIIGKFASKAK